MAKISESDQLNESLLKYCKIPSDNDIVWKDECVCCFDNPMFNQDEFYICLSSWIGVCKRHLDLFLNEKDVYFYLVVKRTKLTQEPLPKKPTKLAIGMDGGFDEFQKSQFSDEYFLASASKCTGLEYIKYEELNLPEHVKTCINTIKSKVGSILNSVAATWNGEQRIITKHSNNLYQIENPPTISSSGWKCSECDKTDNLWMNLTDGVMLCGRKYYDGSGGNNHSELHYLKNKYPLVVKLGTIGTNNIDLYSYDEEEMVEDTELDKHLLHFGIDKTKFHKTEKTVSEMEVEINYNLQNEWDTIQEREKTLEPLYGPGYTGIINMGNTCYLAAIFQILFSMPEIKYQFSSSLLSKCLKKPSDLVKDVFFQLCKVCDGLYSGRYSTHPMVDDNFHSRGIRPLMLKHALCSEHPEFKSFHQQDVVEFFLFLFQQLEDCEAIHNTGTNIDNYFTFESLSYFKLKEGNEKIISRSNKEKIIRLPVPIDEALNTKEYQEYIAKITDPKKLDTSSCDPVRLNVPYEKCIQRYCEASMIESLNIDGISGPGYNVSRVKSLSTYIILQVCKFTIDPCTYRSRKLDVSIPFPDELDLSPLLKEPDFTNIRSTNDPTQPDITASLCSELTNMGFPINVCIKAIKATKAAGIDQAVEWILTNPNSNDNDESEVCTSEESISSLTCMGFSRKLAIKALTATNQDVERAADYLLANIEKLITEIEADELNAATRSPTKDTCNNKSCDSGSLYKLVGFISHMGSSTTDGHYVCHIYKDDKWVIYNDRQVATSINPPKDMGYLYFYRKK